MAFHGIKKWEKPASTAEKVSIHSNVRRIPADTRAREIAAKETREKEQEEARKQRNEERPKLSRLLTIQELQKYLEKRGHTDACKNLMEGVTRCDPWKYEFDMLEDLLKARNESMEPQYINTLRDLILAGSHMTYERKSERDILQEAMLQLEIRRRHLDVIARLPRIKQQDDEYSIERERNAYSDPSTLLEVKQDRADASDELANVEQSIRERRVGKDLEEATRTVENLILKNWGELKKSCILHKIKPEEARNNKFTRPLVDAIEDLRHIRDLLYYRRLHGDWAELGFQGEKKLSA